MEIRRKIKIEHLSKTFKENMVLKDISLEMESGKIYGIIGRNGSGKTVLFKCICGFVIPDNHSVYVDGELIGKQRQVLADAGIIIEEPAFLANRSGYKNLEFLYCINHQKDKEHIYKIMKLVGLDPDCTKKVKHYSMGMRQRLAIAQAIMEDQSILILDEPMNGLDKEGVRDMRKLFLELKRQGKLILLASHNRDDINILCDEIFEIDKGIVEKVDNMNG